jgi:hypothetical protein
MIILKRILGKQTRSGLRTCSVAVFRFSGDEFSGSTIIVSHLIN